MGEYYEARSRNKQERFLYEKEGGRIDGNER